VGSSLGEKIFLQRGGEAVVKRKKKDSHKIDWGLRKISGEGTCPKKKKPNREKKEKAFL